MRKYLLLLLILFFNNNLFAATDFPSDWRDTSKFVKINTKLSNLKHFPSCSQIAIGYPDIYQELFDTYCELGDKNGLGKIEILTDVKNVYFDKNLSINKGFIILRIKQLKTLFVMEFKNNKISFGVWSEDGKNLGNNIEKHPLNDKTCMNCHSVYNTRCVSGICGQIIERKFQ